MPFFEDVNWMSESEKGIFVNCFNTLLVSNPEYNIQFELPSCDRKKIYISREQDDIEISRLIGSITPEGSRYPVSLLPKAFNFEEIIEICDQTFSTFSVSPYLQSTAKFSHEKYKRKIFVCPNCGEMTLDVGSVENCTADQTTLCYRCSHTAIPCSICNRVLDIERKEDGICKECADNLVECHNCGVPVKKGMYVFEKEEHCKTCYKSHMAENDYEILPHFYRPDWNYYPMRNSDTIYYGIELEVAYAGEQDVGKVKTELGEFAYVVEDGSVEGFEIVTHPATFEYLCGIREKFNELFTYFNLNDIRAEDSCGIHIHVSRKPFGEENIEKLMLIFDKFWEEIVCFSRRKTYYLNKYAANKGEKTSAEGIKAKKKNIESKKDKYVAVNLRNPNTFEIRVFKSTTSITEFYAILQFVYVLIQKIPNYSFEEIESLDWQGLVASEYAELNCYLRERGLDNNEFRKYNVITENENLEIEGEQDGEQMLYEY